MSSSAPTRGWTVFATTYPRAGARAMSWYRSSTSSVAAAAASTTGHSALRTSTSAASVTPAAGKNDAVEPSAPNHENDSWEPTA